MQRFVLLCVLVFFLVPLASGEILIVNPEGTGDFPTIQSAIDVSVDGDVVELMDGTYFGPGNVNLDYHGKAITVRSQSGVAENCIIDCDDDDESSRAISFHSGEGIDSCVESISIVGCRSLTSGAIHI